MESKPFHYIHPIQAERLLRNTWDNTIEVLNKDWRIYNETLNSGLFYQALRRTQSLDQATRLIILKDIIRLISPTRFHYLDMHPDVFTIRLQRLLQTVDSEPRFEQFLRNIRLILFPLAEQIQSDVQHQTSILRRIHGSNY